MPVKAPPGYRSQNFTLEEISTARDSTAVRPYPISEGNLMSLTGLEVFDETLHKTNIWLKEIEQVLGPDRHRAYQALRARAALLARSLADQ
jgi:hypothetical protein